MQVVTKDVEKGDWRTLEWSWNVPFAAWFKAPAGAKVKIRYGAGFVGADGNKVTLNGTTTKVTASGFGVLARARLQIKTTQDCMVTYLIAMGNPNELPIPF